MRVLSVLAIVGVVSVCASGLASAQGWNGPGYGYRGPDYDDGAPRRARGGYFDEREYLRCHPDVARAVRRGQEASGYAHWRRFGRDEGRRLRC